MQKQGADFSYNGKWSYQPLFVSMASTGECLAVRNRPGNLRSGDGAAEAVDEVLQWTTEHCDNILVRGDRWVVTNLPDDFSAEDVIDHTYQRCDQENVIEQLGSGLAGWRLPLAQFDGNSAWLVELVRFPRFRVVCVHQQRFPR